MLKYNILSKRPLPPMSFPILDLYITILIHFSEIRKKLIRDYYIVRVPIDKKEAK